MTAIPLTGKVERVLIAFLPDAYRDDVAGDLIEEASTVIAPRDGDFVARRWVRSELLRSTPRMFSLHFRQKEDDEMKHAKWLAAAAIVAVGLLQAWDSGILAAPPWIGAIVILAIAIGLAGVFTEHELLRLSIAAAVLILLFVARMLSPVALPELTLIALPVFLILVCAPRLLAMAKEKNGPKGPGAPA